MRRRGGGGYRVRGEGGDVTGEDDLKMASRAQPLAL